jgi:hypothetical protein
MHWIRVKGLYKPGGPARINVSPDLRDVPDMMAEPHTEIAKQPGIFKFLEAGRKAGPGRGDIVHMDFQEGGKIGIQDKGLVLIQSREDCTPVSGIGCEFYEPRAVMQVYLVRVTVHLVLLCEHPGGQDCPHHAFICRIQGHCQYFMPSTGYIQQEIPAQKVDLLVAGPV